MTGERNGEMCIRDRHEQLYEGYSAQEQYSTAEFEGRYTDEYSLAAVFYRMVCGRCV